MEYIVIGRENCMSDPIPDPIPPSEREIHMFSSRTLLLTLLFLGACGGMGLTKKISSNEHDTNMTLLPSPTPNEYLMMLKDHPEVVERSNRTRLLSKYSKIDGHIFVGSDSIIPPVTPDLVEKPSIDPEVLRDFVERNKSKTKIDPLFDVYCKVELVDLNGPVEDKLVELRKSFPESAGVVLFSQMGRNSDYSKTLIYLEHYALTGKLTREYCAITWVQTSNDVSQTCFNVE